jgi:hypothetical protein
MPDQLKISFFAASLVSAYWNGAATYYRGIVRALAERGHRITFFEPDAYDRQKHRDIPDPSWATVVVYPSAVATSAPGRRPPGRTHSMTTTHSATLATMSATTPELTRCSAQTTAPFPHASMSTPASPAHRHSPGVGRPARPRSRAAAATRTAPRRRRGSAPPP